MSLKITNFKKGYVANAILSLLAKRFEKNDFSEAISLDVLASEIDCPVTDIREALAKLEKNGELVRETLEPWDSVSSFVVSKPSFRIATGQLRMVESESKQEDNSADGCLRDIYDGEPLQFECGHIDIAAEGAEEEYLIVGVYRAGIVHGDEPRAALLSIARRLDDEEVKQDIYGDRTFEVEGVPGQWILLIDKQSFIDVPADPELEDSVEQNAWDLAYTWLEEYLIGLNPTQEQCKAIGLDPMTDEGAQEAAS